MLPQMHDIYHNSNKSPSVNTPQFAPSNCEVITIANGEHMNQSLLSDNSCLTQAQIRNKTLLKQGSAKQVKYREGTIEELKLITQVNINMDSLSNLKPHDINF